MQELDPGCGIEDFNKVLTEYSFVTSLYSTYDSDTSSGAYVSNLPDDRPEVTNIINCHTHYIYHSYFLAPCLLFGRVWKKGKVGFALYHISGKKSNN